MLRTRATAIVILAGVMGLSMISLAQQTNQYKPDADAWALQFSIGSNFQLGSFQGAMLSIKKHTSPMSAWRLGMGLNGEFYSTEQSERRGIPDTLSQSSTTDTDNVGIEIQVQYLKYLSLDSDIKPYFAGGPRVSYSSSSQSSDLDIYQSSISTNDVALFGAGIVASFGGEWFVTQSLSFFAEYGLYLGYQYRSTESKQSSMEHGNYFNEKITTDSFVIDDLGARLGLSMYF